MLKKLTSDLKTSLKWTGFGAVVNVALQILFIAILARLLTPEHFGLVAVLTALTAFMNVFVHTAFSASLIHQDRVDGNHETVALIFSIVVGLFLSLILLSLAGVVEIAIGIPGLRNVIYMSALLVLLDAAGATSLNLLKRDFQFKQIALRNIISYLSAYAVVGIPLAIIGAGHWALIAAITSQTVINNFMLILMRPPRISVSNINTAFADLSPFAFGNTVASFFSRASVHSDNLVVAGILGASAAGVYQQAYRIVSYPANLFGEIFGKVLFPFFSRGRKVENYLSEIIPRVDRILLILLGCFSVSIYVASERLVELLLGDQWGAVVNVLQYMVVALPFRVAYKVDYELLKALGKVYWLSAVQFGYFIAVVCGAVLGSVLGSLDLVAFFVAMAIIANYLGMKLMVVYYLEVPLTSAMASIFGAAVLVGIYFIMISSAESAFGVSWKFHAFIHAPLAGSMLGLFLVLCRKDIMILKQGVLKGS